MIACLSTVRCAREKSRERGDNRRFDIVRDRPELFIDRRPARRLALPAAGRRRPLGTERSARDRRMCEDSSAALFHPLLGGSSRRCSMSQRQWGCHVGRRGNVSIRALLMSRRSRARLEVRPFPHRSLLTANHRFDRAATVRHGRPVGSGGSGLRPVGSGGSGLRPGMWSRRAAQATRPGS